MAIRDTQASIVLDLFRMLAAQAVVVGHTIGIFGILIFAQPPHVPYMQNIAVLVFFLLSGFLIAYTLVTRSSSKNYDFWRYFIDRFARIYPALFAALIVIAVLDFVWLKVTGETRSTFTRRAFIGSLLMLNDLGGPLSRFHASSFGTAGQLWTLAIEWHLYLFAGAIFFVRRSWWMLVLAAAFCTVPLAYLWERPGLDYGHGLTLLWGLGFGGYYLLPQLIKLHAWQLSLIAGTSAVLYCWLIDPGWEFQINTYPLLASAFLGSIALASRFKASEGLWTRIIRFGAAYSFTLYLVHNTLVKATWKLWHGDPYVAAVFCILGSNVLAIAIAVHTEMRHRAFANYLWNRMERLFPGMRSANIDDEKLVSGTRGADGRS